MDKVLNVLVSQICNSRCYFVTIHLGIYGRNIIVYTGCLIVQPCVFEKMYSTNLYAQMSFILLRFHTDVKHLLIAHLLS